MLYASILTLLSPHHLEDVLLWIPFLVGQLLYLLFRAGKAIRNPDANIHTRRGYFYKNWDIALIRAFAELPIYWGWRHVPLAYLIGLTGIQSAEWIQMLWGSAIAGALLGFASDFLLIAASTWKRTPEGIRRFIAENLPQFPEGGSGT